MGQTWPRFCSFVHSSCLRLLFCLCPVFFCCLRTLSVPNSRKLSTAEPIAKFSVSFVEMRFENKTMAQVVEIKKGKTLLSKDKQKMWPTEFYLFYIFILFSLSVSFPVNFLEIDRRKKKKITRVIVVCSKKERRGDNNWNERKGREKIKYGGKKETSRWNVISLLYPK